MELYELVCSLGVLLLFPIAEVSTFRHPAIRKHFNKYPIGDLLEQDDRQLIVTSTVTDKLIIKETKTTILAVACAKIVNVSSACRNHEHHWNEKPIVLSFDDDTDKLIDILFTPVLGIQQSKAIRFSRELQFPNNENYEPHLISGSIEEMGDSRQPRIFFREIFEFVSRYMPRPTSSSQSTTTITVTQKETKTFTVPITTTNTFFIQGCTPSPFPFKECHKKHHNNYSDTVIKPDHKDD